MRRVRSAVAMSLDGYIAGPKVDQVEVAIIPVLLGGGLPLLPLPSKMAKLRLANKRIYDKTGTVALENEVIGR